MNRYKITIDYELVIKKRITKLVRSRSRDEAEKSVIDTINPADIKVIGIETNFIPYRTDLWRDLEDLLLEEDGDGDDKSDIEYILDQLIDKEFKKAAIRYKSLDDSIRSKVPDRISDLFSDLGLL